MSSHITFGPRALALTDKSEWRLTAVTCSTRYFTSGGTLSGFQRWWDVITTNPHECTLWVLVQKCLFSLSGHREDSLKAGKKPRLSDDVIWGRKPLKFSTVGSMREEGWGGLLVRRALAWNNSTSAGMPHAGQSRTGTTFLHQWAKVGQKTTLFSSCYKWRTLWARVGFEHVWAQNLWVLFNVWSLPHRNPCWVQVFLGLIHLWLKGNLNT